MPKEPVLDGRGAGGDVPNEPVPNGTLAEPKLKARPVRFPYNGQL